eukprot:scaffold222179_cov52-Prasinocladus_malaysianus.AAC.3
MEVVRVLENLCVNHVYLLVSVDGNHDTLRGSLVVYAGEGMRAATGLNRLVPWGVRHPPQQKLWVAPEKRGARDVTTLRQSTRYP